MLLGLDYPCPNPYKSNCGNPFPQFGTHYGTSEYPKTWDGKPKPKQGTEVRCETIIIFAGAIAGGLQCGQHPPIKQHEATLLSRRTSLNFTYNHAGHTNVCPSQFMYFSSNTSLLYLRFCCRHVNHTMNLRYDNQRPIHSSK